MTLDKLFWIIAIVCMGLAAIGVSINSNPNPDGTGARFSINFFNLAWVFVFLTFVV